MNTNAATGNFAKIRRLMSLDIKYEIPWPA